jgi:hypothetical protein
MIIYILLFVIILLFIRLGLTVRENYSNIHKHQPKQQTTNPSQLYGKEYDKSMHRMMKGDYPKEDCEFLKDMIYHHQIAVDMARVLINHTKRPQILQLCRDIIWAQTYEIWYMRALLNAMPYESLFFDVAPLNQEVISKPPLGTYFPIETGAKYVPKCRQTF